MYTSTLPAQHLDLQPDGWHSQHGRLLELVVRITGHKPTRSKPGWTVKPWAAERKWLHRDTVIVAIHVFWLTACFVVRAVGAGIVPAN